MEIQDTKISNTDDVDFLLSNKSADYIIRTLRERSGMNRRESSLNIQKFLSEPLRIGSLQDVLPPDMSSDCCATYSNTKNWSSTFNRL